MFKDERALREYITALNRQIIALKKTHYDAKCQLAELMCPVAVGDTVSFKFPEGSPREPNPDRYLVTAVLPARWEGSDYIVKGRKLKKDGTPGQRITELRQWYGGLTKEVSNEPEAR